MTGIELRHHRELTDAVRHELAALYAEVRAPLLHLPNYALPAFGERLQRHGGEPCFEAVIGYAYGNTVEAADRWWTRMARPMPHHLTAAPVFALKELGVRTPWRGTGAARRIHDALLAARPEERAMLMVNPAAGDGKVHALYRAWDYVDVNEVRPHQDAPALVAMLYRKPTPVG